MSLLRFFKRFPDDEYCLEYLEEIRFGGGPFCPLCNCNHVARKRDGQRRGRWNCYSCRSSFNVLSRTMFQGTKIPLQKWFLAIHLILSHRKGISSHQMARELDMRQQSAWRMMTRIRREMFRIVKQTLLKGIIEADETYIGRRSNIRGWGTTKTKILGAVERQGNVVAEVINDIAAETIKEFMGRYLLNVEDIELMTDGLTGYLPMGQYVKHSVLKRRPDKKFYGRINTNTIESVWALLKRARAGAHHDFRPEWTQLYVAEMCYRYNSRADHNAFDTFLQDACPLNPLRYKP